MAKRNKRANIKKELNAEQLRRGINASTKNKLRWLEEMQKFIINFTPRLTLLQTLKIRGVKVV